MRTLGTFVALVAIGLGVPIAAFVVLNLLFGDPSVGDLLDAFELPPGAVETRRYEGWQDGVKPGNASVWFTVPREQAPSMRDDLAGTCDELGLTPGPEAPERTTPNGGTIHLVCEGREGSRVVWVELFQRCEAERCDAMLDVFSFYN